MSKKNENRRPFTTTIDLETQVNFHRACIGRYLKMNDVIEEFFKLFIEDPHILEKMREKAGEE